MCLMIASVNAHHSVVISFNAIRACRVYVAKLVDCLVLTLGLIRVCYHPAEDISGHLFFQLIRNYQKFESRRHHLKAHPVSLSNVRQGDSLVAIDLTY